MEATDEAERLAKAARARALLKKRQKKKVAGESAATSVGSPLAGIISPSPPGSVFSGGASEAGDLPSEFGEIPSGSHEKLAIRKNSSAHSPLPKAEHLADASSLFAAPVDSVTQAQLDNQQRTIALLVSEKAALSTTLQNLESDIQRAAQEHAAALEESQTEITRLSSRVGDLQDELQSSATARAQLISRGQEREERTHDMERELEKLKRSLAESQTRSKAHEARIRELEEEAQASDQIEALEKSLKGTQERAESLEFQLSKSKQAHAKLKAELESGQTKYSELAASESNWKAKHTSLETELSTLQQTLSSLATAHDALRQEQQLTVNKHATSQAALEGSNQLLAAARAELTSATSQLQREIANSSTSARRAEDAEAAQQKLQAENVELMASLNEMRPKVVELTQDKVTLSEETDRLQRSVRALNETVSQLEGSLSEVRSELDAARHSAQDNETRWHAEKAELERGIKELERGYGDLEEELRNSRASVQELDAGRASHRKAVAQYEETLEGLHSTVSGQTAELTSLRDLLGETQRAESELRELLGQNQSELESLRGEVGAKEEEILRLNDQLAIQTQPPTPNGHRPQESIGGEMMTAVQQQHALELSSARSQIRTLENSVYAEQTRAHGLQQQIAALENELVSLRRRPPPGAASSSLRMARPLSAQSNHSTQYAGSARGGPPPSRLSVVSRGALNPFDDAALSPDTRHKRKVSLSMLKARIESERGLFVPPPVSGSSVGASPQAPLASLAEVSPSGTPHHPPKHDLHEHGYAVHQHDHDHGHEHEHHLSDGASPVAVAPERSQFRDEAHIFWCHACSGDLVVL